MIDHADEVKRALTDPAKLCGALGLLDGSQRQARGVLIRCPYHGEKVPSCSVTVGPDGTVRVKCFACGKGDDALGLVAQSMGLDARSEFRDVLAEGARLAGMSELEAEIRDGKPRPDRERPPVPEAKPEPEYLDPREVWAFWRACVPVTDDTEASGLLVRRSIDPGVVEARQLARALPAGELPRWARYHGKDWNETGHRIVVRTFDHFGNLHGVRAIQVRTVDGPKRLPPAGQRAAGLCMLNANAFRMLGGRITPRLVVVEGEPDFLSHCVLHEEATIGLVSGAWTKAFADRVPDGCRVVILTHNDPAGDRYAEKVTDTLSGRKVTILRGQPEAA